VDVGIVPLRLIGPSTGRTEFSKKKSEGTRGAQHCTIVNFSDKKYISTLFFI
jgi:hypothetical protein